MHLVEGIAFDEYDIESVKLNLMTCVLTLNVIYHKDNKRISRLKEYTFPTTCDVDINEYIKKVETLINAKTSIL
jgi:hypothetical protein